MKTLRPSTQRGQALVMIALAAIGLFAFAALAIDGSAIFSDRRHAQNAADTSALAAALTKVRGGDWHDAAYKRATSNSYNNNGTTNVVEVHLCSETGITCEGMPTGANPTQYIQVRITSHVRTYFTRIIGRSETINRVEAVARAVPGYNANLFGGRALVALNQNACPAFEYTGSSTTTVTGSGIFVNSRCDGTGSYSQTNQALNSSSNSSRLIVPCYNVVGGITVPTSPSTLISDGSCANSTNNSSLFMTNPLATYASPDIPCPTTPATFSTANGTTTLNPGLYDNSNSGNTFPPNGSASNIVMNSGIYCIDIGNHTFSLSGGTLLTGNDVLIYMKTGAVKWTSGSLNLSAISRPDYDYRGLLLIMASGNTSDVAISGNQGSSFTGTILAPESNVSLSGGSSTGNILNNQIIGNTITLSGSNSLNINYQADQQWQPPVPPAVEMTQ